MNIKCSGIVLILLFLGGCATTGSLFDEQAIPNNIEMSEYSLEVLDKREGVQELPPKVSFFSVPWQDNKASLVVGDEAKRRFNRVIDGVKTKSDRTMEFKIEIFEGYLQFVANSFSEKEIVSWKLNLKVFSNSSKALDGDGSCRGERESIDASPKRLKAMYLKCFEKAIIDALLNGEKANNTLSNDAASVAS